MLDRATSRYRFGGNARSERGALGRLPARKPANDNDAG